MKTHTFKDAGCGRTFTAKLIEPGDRYGRDDCLTFHADKFGKSLIEFYLGDYFVSRYYAETLRDRRHPTSVGLCLHGGGTYDPSISIDAESLRSTLDAFFPPLTDSAEAMAEQWGCL